MLQSRYFEVNVLPRFLYMVLLVMHIPMPYVLFMNTYQCDAQSHCQSHAQPRCSSLALAGVLGDMIDENWWQIVFDGVCDGRHRQVRFRTGADDPFHVRGRCPFLPVILYL